MKKFISILAIMLTFLSCSDKAKDLVKEAQNQAQITFKELAKKPETAKLSNFSTAYSNDSLCIIRFDFTAENAFGVENTEKYEYVYYVSGGKKYEAESGLNSDSIFVTTEQMEKDKKGTIYETCSYEDALLYKVIVHLNNNGRVVDNHSEEVNLTVPTGTGLWTQHAYVDEFGDKTENTYIALSGKGVFSNSAATNSEMSAILFVDKTSIWIRLVEYRSSVVKDTNSYDFRIKGEEGEIYDWRLYNTTSGNMYLDSEQRTEFRKLLMQGGTISVNCQENNYYATVKSTYKFKLKVEGYENAIKYVH